MTVILDIHKPKKEAAALTGDTALSPYEYERDRPSRRWHQWVGYPQGDHNGPDLFRPDSYASCPVAVYSTHRLIAARNGMF